MDASQLNSGKLIYFKNSAKNERALIESRLVGLGGPLELQSAQVGVPKLTIDVNCEKFESFLNNDA